MKDSIAQAIEQICRRDSGFAASCQQYRSDVRQRQACGVLMPSDIAGKRVLDWECGRGAFSAVLLEHGAAHVTGIDSWLDVGYINRTLYDLPNSEFERIPLDEFAVGDGRRESFDLILANTVTEHMLRLPNLLTYCRRLLRPGGVLMLGHDNYYQPVGSHDHGFLRQEGDRVVYRGPKCWETLEKCDASRDFRESLKQSFPWTWDQRMDARLTPKNCEQCPCYRRAQPWAHLLYQNDFRDVFPQPCFTTGYRKSSLNKVTPFQLRQFLIEAGFRIDAWHNSRITNAPPPELSQPPFNMAEDDLCTSYIFVRGVADGTVEYAHST